MTPREIDELLDGRDAETWRALGRRLDELAALDRVMRRPGLMTAPPTTPAHTRTRKEGER